MLRPLFLSVLFALQASAPSTRPSDLANEVHQIAPVTDSGSLVRIRDASNKDGTPLVLYPPEAWKCMTWSFEPIPGTSDVRLVNVFTHKTVAPSANTAGASILQHPAKAATSGEGFHFSQLGGDVYRIDHSASGLTLSLSPAGKITLQPWTGDETQKWKLLPKPDPFTG